MPTIRSICPCQKALDAVPRPEAGVGCSDVPFGMEIAYKVWGCRNRRRSLGLGNPKC